MTAKPKAKRKDTRFKKGMSGNQKGKPKGARNKVTMAVESLLDGQGEALAQKAIDLALGGDMTALRLCLERICPPRKSRPIEIDLPKVETAEDIAAAQGVVINAMGRGEITPEDARIIGDVLESRRRAIETIEHEKRIEALEAAAKPLKPKFRRVRT